MKDFLKPKFMEDAAVRPGHPWGLELMICIAIYFVGSIVMSIIQTPGLMVWLLRDTDYLALIQSGSTDLAKILNVMSDMPEWMTILSLVSEIGLVITYCAYCKIVEKRKLYTMGFVKKKGVLWYLMGLFLGGLILVPVLGIGMGTGIIKFEGLASDLLPGYIALYFVGFMIQGLAEEVMCHGFLFVSLTRRYPVVMSALMSSFLFAIMHSFNAGLTITGYINLFLFATFAALLMVRYENIWLIAGLHCMWNFVQGNVFGLSVSGMSKMNSIFNTTLVSNMSAVNGGKFGLEGGYLVTLVLLLGLFVVVKDLQRQGKWVKFDLKDLQEQMLRQQKYQKEQEELTRQRQEKGQKENPWKRENGYTPYGNKNNETENDGIRDQKSKPQGKWGTDKWEQEVKKEQQDNQKWKDAAQEDGFVEAPWHPDMARPEQMGQGPIYHQEEVKAQPQGPFQTDFNKNYFDEQ